MRPDRPHIPYTAESLQKFIGFKDGAGLHSIKDTLNALALVEGGILRQSDIGDLTVYKTKLVTQVAREYDHAPKEVQRAVVRGVGEKLRKNEITGFDKDQKLMRPLKPPVSRRSTILAQRVKPKRRERGEKIHTQNDAAIKLATELDRNAADLRAVVQTDRNAIGVQCRLQCIGAQQAAHRLG